MSAFPPPKPSLSLIGWGEKSGEMSDVNITQDPNMGLADSIDSIC